MENSPDPLALRLERLLRDRAHGDRYIVFNSGQACEALGCSPEELHEALLLLMEHGAVLHVEERPFDTDGAFHQRN